MGHPVRERQRRKAVCPSRSTPFLSGRTLLVWMVVAVFELALGFVAF
jgi:hypothetical protein